MIEDFTQHISEEISEEIKKFVDDEVFGESEYLFIEKIEGKNYGHCTKCHEEYWIAENYKHNSLGVCPVCGAKLKVKLNRYGKKNCRNDACFYYFEKSIIDPNVIVCKGYYVTRDYDEDYRDPKTEYMQEAIYIFKDKESRMLKLNYSNFYGGRWSEKKSVFDFNQNWLATKMCYISRNSIRKAVKGTRFQYIPSKLLQGYHSTVKVFDEFAKYPWLEQLYKMGFESIVEAKLRGDLLYNCLNYKGKDIFKKLKLTRRDVKDIINSKVKITPLLLSVYQMQIKDSSGLTPVEVEKISEELRYNLEKLKNIIKYVTMKKAVRYMGKQYEKYKKYYHGISSVAIAWSDYLDNCIELEMDLKSENVIFPKDVYKAHENTTKQIRVKSDEILNDKISKRVNDVNQRYKFQYNDLIIRAAENTEELIAEGKELSHCVATNYTKPYSKGETDILFIRKLPELDKPYYTVEIKDYVIKQIQGKRHCSPNEEVKKFIEAFKAEKLIDKKKVQKSA